MKANLRSSAPSAVQPDPEDAMQEVPDWSVQLALLAFAAWCGVLRYGPSVLLVAFYAAITSATAAILIHHLSR
jgi:hypothetical protein